MKKEYAKPQVIKVSLKVEQTVLGNCKTEAAEEGPGYDPGCRAGASVCSTIGS